MNEYSVNLIVYIVYGFILLDLGWIFSLPPFCNKCESVIKSQSADIKSKYTTIDQWILYRRMAWYVFNFLVMILFHDL